MTVHHHNRPRQFSEGGASPVGEDFVSSSLSFWDGVFQLERPSPHSYVIMLSHVSFFLCIGAAIQRSLYLESAALVLSCAISLLYHLCDENFYCAAGFDIHAWHTADVWSTFFLICFVMGVMMLDIRSAALRLALRGCYLFVVTLFVWLDPGNMLLLGSLLLSVAGSVVVRYSFFPPEEVKVSVSSDDLLVFSDVSLCADCGLALPPRREGDTHEHEASSRLLPASVDEDTSLLGIGGGTPNRSVVNRNRRPILMAGSTRGVGVGEGEGANNSENTPTSTLRQCCGCSRYSSKHQDGGPRLANGKGGQRETPKLRKSPQQRERERYLAIALGVFTFALACFVVANTPVVGPETYNEDTHGPHKPMDVPDTAVYWVFHSVWHFSSAIAGYYMVRFMSN